MWELSPNTHRKHNKYKWTKVADWKQRLSQEISPYAVYRDQNTPKGWERRIKASEAVFYQTKWSLCKSILSDKNC